MTRLRILLVMMMGVGSGLGGCGSSVITTASIGDTEAMNLGQAITPEKETSRLIEMMNKVKLTHHTNAVHEIETR